MAMATGGVNRPGPNFDRGMEGDGAVHAVKMEERMPGVSVWGPIFGLILSES
jgi:hypothetical protein